MTVLKSKGIKSLSSSIWMWARGPHCLSPTPTLSSDPQFHLVVQAGASRFTVSVFLHISHFGTWYEKQIHKFNSPTLGSTSSFKQELHSSASFIFLTCYYETQIHYWYTILQTLFLIGHSGRSSLTLLWKTYLQKTAFLLVKRKYSFPIGSYFDNI